MDHLAHTGSLAREHEETKRHHADEIADHEHGDCLEQAQPELIPKEPSTQLIGAMFAPAHIQNW